MEKDKSTCRALKKALLFSGRLHLFRNLQHLERRKNRSTRNNQAPAAILDASQNFPRSRKVRYKGELLFQMKRMVFLEMGPFHHQRRALSKLVHIKVLSSQCWNYIMLIKYQKSRFSSILLKGMVN